MIPSGTQLVTRRTRSPLNPDRWCLDLACGHEKWVTSSRRPVGKKVLCNVCLLRAGREETCPIP